MLLAALGVSPLRAQEPSTQPTNTIRRLVARIDFEDPTGSGEPVPRHWAHTQLPGGRFPSYVEGAVSEDYAAEGVASFSMHLDGGNVAYSYTGQLTVHPNNDYLLTGQIRTDGLNLARAQARLEFLDAAGRPVEGSLAVSEPFGGPGSPSRGQWRRFEVRLRGQFSDATRLRITLAILQPSLWQGENAPDVYAEDITGSAWWDDLAIYRLPRVELDATAEGNVFAPGQAPSVRMLIDGVDQADCAAVLTLRDAAGTVRSRQVVAINPNEWTLDDVVELGALEPGLYHAELMIAAGGDPLAYERTSLAVLGPAPASSRSGLGIDAVTTPAEDWPTLLHLARLMQAGQIKLSAWPLTGAGPAGDEAAWPLPQMLTRCREAGMRPTIVAANLPPASRVAGMPSGRLIEALAAEDPILHRELNALAVRLGSRAATWQIGDVRDYEQLWSLTHPRAHAVARRWLQDLLVETDVPIAWNVLFTADQAGPGQLAALTPPSVMPEEIPAQLTNFDGRIHDLTLERQDETTDRLALLSDLVLRYAYARVAGVHDVFVDPPWRFDARGRIEPTESLVVLRTLAAYLGDAEYVGLTRLGPTSVAMVFRAAGNEGRLLVYSRPAEVQSDDTALLDLPASAYAVDLWGRRSELPRRDGQVRLHSGPIPQIIAGCEIQPLALRASMRFEPEVLPSTYEKHNARVSFTNPFDQPVVGTISFDPPEGWVVRPLVSRFHLAAGETWTGELEINFPYNEPLGLKQLDAIVQIDARRQWVVQAPAPFFLAMEGVVFDVIQSHGPNGSLEIQQLVSNHTDHPLSFNCWVQIPDRPRQSRLIRELPPGATVVKLFRFENRSELRGLNFRAGLHQVEGPAVLNRTGEIR